MHNRRHLEFIIKNLKNPQNQNLINTYSCTGYFTTPVVLFLSVDQQKIVNTEIQKSA